jgi:hypothetical protein
MGEDFEVFVPDDHFQRFTFKPQSGEEVVTEAQNTTEPSAPLQKVFDEVGPGMQDNALINLVFTGESIMSFRQLLKRYNLWRRELTSTTQENTEWRGVRSAFPFLRGNVAGAVDTTGALAAYNYSNTVLLHWVTMAFSSWRGSIRYKMSIANRVQQKSAVDPAMQVGLYVERLPFNSSVYSNNKRAYATLTSNEEAASAALPGGATNYELARGVKGMLYATTEINPIAEFEVPYYAPIRFSPGKQENFTSALPNSESFAFNYFGFTSNRSTMDFYVAAGEDFQTYFWTGLPRMYYELTPPAP